MKSITEEQEYNYHVNLYLNKDMFEELRFQAIVKDIPFLDYIRQALSIYLEEK